MAKKSTMQTVITWVMLGITLLAITGIAVFFGIFTNGFKTDFQEFYITVAGENERSELITQSKTLDVDINKKYRVEPKYVMGLLSKTAETEYTVTVTPNITSATNFEYTVMGQSVKYSQVTDMSALVNLTVQDTYFEFEVTDDLPKLLERLYRTEDIQGVPSAINSDHEYITVRVYSVNNKTCIALTLKLWDRFTADEITLDKTEIVF